MTSMWNGIHPLRWLATSTTTFLVYENYDEQSIKLKSLFYLLGSKIHHFTVVYRSFQILSFVLNFQQTFSKKNTYTYRVFKQPTYRRCSPFKSCNPFSKKNLTKNLYAEYDI